MLNGKNLYAKGVAMHAAPLDTLYYFIINHGINKSRHHSKIFQEVCYLKCIEWCRGQFSNESKPKTDSGFRLGEI